jgi:uncharacterized protein YPO0396
LQTQQDTIKARLDALSKLDEYGDFQELDWQSLATEIARLQEEKRQLEAASDILKTLSTRLAELIATRQATEKQLAEHRDKRSKTEQRRADAQWLQEQTRALLHDPAQGSLADRFERLDAMRAEALGEHQLTVESCDNRERELRDWLQTRIDAEDQRLKRLRDKIIDGMRAYCTAYPLDTQEVDVSIESAQEYRTMLDKLAGIKDRKFETQEVFEKWLTDNGITGQLREEVVNRVPKSEQRRVDIILCIDAADGTTVWKKEYPHAHGYQVSARRSAC